MKLNPALIFLLGTILLSCRKNITSSTADVRVTHISEIGGIRYDANGRMVSVGNEVLLYGTSGLLEGSRMTTVLHSPYGDISETYRYRFIRQNDVIVAMQIDTFLRETANPLGIPNVQLVTNLPRSQYHYSQGRIDSVTYLTHTTSNPVTKEIFRYDANGNVSQSIVYSQDASSGFPLNASREIVSTYQYDDQPNPYYMLFKQAGVILPSLENKPLSKNNRTSGAIQANFGGQLLFFNVQYDYEYNQHGYPTSIITGQGSPTEKVIQIQYDR